MSARRNQPLERHVAAAILLVAVLAAMAAVGAMEWIHGRQARSDAEANAVSDAVARAVAEGSAPQPLLDTLVAAGTIRAGSVTDASGASISTSGIPSPDREQTCRSLPAGGLVCVEPAEVTTGGALGVDTLRRGGVALGLAVVLGGAAAWLTNAAMRRRASAMGKDIENAMRDQSYATRMQDESGALAPLTASVNSLLDQMQSREVAFRRRTMDLEAANKDLEAFAAAVSHDLRAPLGSIAGFAQALDEDYREKLDEVGQECIFWIRESAKQMSVLVEALLQMARLSRKEVQRTDVDVTTIARQIAGVLQRTHPDREVEFVIPDGLVANADERLLQAVLENLISNAWKFTSKRPNARIEVGIRHEDGTPALYVRDNGAGFDPQHAAKMFRPFQRLHSEKEFSGTGIGLATVQKIVQRHGGRAWAEGEPGRGATIFFTTIAPRESFA